MVIFGLLAVLSVFVGLTYIVFSFIDPPSGLFPVLRPNIIRTSWLSDTTISFLIGVFLLIVPPFLLLGMPALLK